MAGQSSSNCTQTSQLSSQDLVLSFAAVNRNSGMRYREMPIQIQTVDVMAGSGGAAAAAGQALLIHHQELGKQAGTTTLAI